MILPSQAQVAVSGLWAWHGRQVEATERSDPARLWRAQRGERGKQMEAYCLKCRTKREMSSPTQVTMKNGKQATRGKCPVCGTQMYRIGKS